MKIKKTIEVKKEIIEFLRCDICNAVISVDRPKEVTQVFHQKGRLGKRIEFDICGECFDTKLVTLLKSIGVEPEVTENFPDEVRSFY